MPFQFGVEYAKNDPCPEFTWVSGRELNDDEGDEGGGAWGRLRTWVGGMFCLGVDDHDGEGA